MVHCTETQFYHHKKPVIECWPLNHWKSCIMSAILAITDDKLVLVDS